MAGCTGNSSNFLLRSGAGGPRSNESVQARLLEGHHPVNGSVLIAIRGEPSPRAPPGGPPRWDARRGGRATRLGAHHQASGSASVGMRRRNSQSRGRWLPVRRTRPRRSSSSTVQRPLDPPTHEPDRPSMPSGSACFRSSERACRRHRRTQPASGAPRSRFHHRPERCVPLASNALLELSQAAFDQQRRELSRAHGAPLSRQPRSELLQFRPA